MPLDKSSLADLSSSSACRAGAVQAVLDRLKPEDREVIERALASAPPIRGRRLNDRDQAVRDISALYDGTPSGSAKAIAVDLSRYLSGAWLRERDGGPPEGSGERRRLLFKIAFFSVGASLSWRQILNVIEGHRGR